VPVVEEENDPLHTPVLVALTPGADAFDVSDAACGPIPYESKK